MAATIQGKLDASYWLGLIEYEQGEYAAALDYFRVRTLQFEPEQFLVDRGALQHRPHFGSQRPAERGDRRL